MVRRKRDRLMTTSLVTGGSGYFGSLLVSRLQEAGHDVRILDLVPDVDHPDVETVIGDIRDRSIVDRAVRGVDLIFHNVAQVPLARDEALLRTVNIDGTRTLLQAAFDHDVTKVVHTSSSAIFGIPTTNPVRLETPANPMEAYGVAKWEAEKLCHDFRARGLDVSIVRPRTILGHGRLGIFGILFDWIADGADPFVLGRGDNRYQFIHAEDLAEVCFLAGHSPGPATFNAGTDRFGTMREALDDLCRHAGTGARVRRLPAGAASAAMRLAAAARVAPFAPYHWMMYSRSMWFDIEHVRNSLGWQPKWSNTEMFIQSYEWFLAHRSVTRDDGRSSHRTSARQGALSILKHSTRILPR
jgi:nucleoside-diphosphate-sugar epimerase